MGSFAVIFFTFFSMLAFADSAATQSEVAGAIGQVLFGADFQQGQAVDTTLAGEKGCVVKVEMNGDFFLIQAIKQNKTLVVESFKPTFMKLFNSHGVQSVSLESEGPCLEGVLPPSASCVVNNNSITVSRDPRGNVQEIKLQRGANRTFQAADVLKCRFN